MEDYKKLLKDGRWQLRKAAIMERDGYTCRICGARAADGSTLNVHHLRYRKGAMPWEYGDLELVTLCEQCHRKEHDKIKSEVYDIRIGDFVSYVHSDYENTGIVYDVDFSTMTARMASIDDGSDYSKLWLDRVKIGEDGSLQTFSGRIVWREKKVILDIPRYGRDDDDYTFYFFELVAECLLRIWTEEGKKDSGYFDTVETELDEIEELACLYGNLSTMMGNNGELREYFKRRNAFG